MEHQSAPNPPLKVKNEFVRLSHISWASEIDEKADPFPGPQFISMACLQRIAKAAEQISEDQSRYVQRLAADYEGVTERNRKLKRENRKLKKLLKKLHRTVQ